MLRHLLLLASTVLFAGCGSDAVPTGGGASVAPPTSSQVAIVRVTPLTAVINVGDTLSLRAATLDAAGTEFLGRVVTWSSESAAIATVSSSGLVRAIAPGAVRINALSEGRTGVASLTILAR